MPGGGTAITLMNFRPPDDADPDVSGGEAIVSQFTGFLLWVDATASYLQVRGITFEAAQGDLVYVDTGSRNVTFERLHLRNSAGMGMIMAGTSHTVDRSVFTALGSLGLVLKSTASSATLTYNEVHRIARHLRNGVAGMAISGGQSRHPAQRDPPPALVGALGMTHQLPTDDRYLMTRAELEARVDVLFGGRVAEKVVFDEVSRRAPTTISIAPPTSSGPWCSNTA